MSIFQAVACNEQILDQAMDAGMSDFEDAIQFFSAAHAGATHLITRDPGHFPGGPLAITSPREFLAIYRQP